MKKVGIITYQDIGDGKGRFLQAYALYSAIVKLGYDAEIINYYPINKDGKIKKSSYKRIIRAISSPKLLLGYITKFQHNIMLKKFDVELLEKRKMYEKFIRHNIKITDKKYYGNKSLQDAKLKYDVYVCGSDQIWNPYFQGMDSTYYLNFAPKQKRIAYAPSLGTIEIDDNKKEFLKCNIQEMPFVSLREESGAKLVSELIGRSVKNVLDPTLLMPYQWWNDFAGESNPDKPYVLTFLFDNSNYPRNVAKEIAKKGGYDIISIPDSFADIFFKSNKEVAIGPERFVNLFKNASFICTQSFHGVILSLIYNRPFYVFDRQTKAYVSGVFSRISDLLKMVKLENRILKNGDSIPKNYKILDFTEANEVLEAKRIDSLVYLKDSIEQSLGGK